MYSRSTRPDQVINSILSFSNLPCVELMKSCSPSQCPPHNLGVSRLVSIQIVCHYLLYRVQPPRTVPPAYPTVVGEVAALVYTFALCAFEGFTKPGRKATLIPMWGRQSAFSIGGIAVCTFLLPPQCRQLEAQLSPASRNDHVRLRRPP